jgi:fatty acid desaturase
MMTPSEKQKMLRTNTLLWLAAIVLPGVFQIAFASTRFPWPVLMPFLLWGALLASNQMLARAMGKPAGDPGPDPKPGD